MSDLVLIVIAAAAPIWAVGLVGLLIRREFSSARVALANLLVSLSDVLIRQGDDARPDPSKASSDLDPI